MTSLIWPISALLKAFYIAFGMSNESHWLDLFACLYNLDMRHTIFFKFLLNQCKDFRFDRKTLDGMFLSMDCWMPFLRVFHKSSTDEWSTALMMDSESWHMSWIFSQFALE